MIVWPTIAPTEMLLRGINWAPRLGTDTISSSSWSASNPTGLTITPTSPPVVGYDTLVMISGAILNVTYTVTNTVITTSGQTEVETVQFTCAPK
jgi:hypothetical protein